MSEAAAAVERFGRRIEWGIDVAISRMVPRGRVLVAKTWTEDYAGRWTITLSFDDETGVSGTGPAKLEALSDLEAAIRRLA